MSDERDSQGNESPPEIKVNDRRRFTAEGEPRSEAPDEPPRPAEPPEVGGARGPARDCAPLPEIDFSTFIISLSSSAMMDMGVDPQTGQSRGPKNLDLARQTIDILGLLQDKTRGNLSDEEDRLLEELLYNLRMAYVEYCKRSSK